MSKLNEFSFFKGELTLGYVWPTCLVTFFFAKQVAQYLTQMSWSERLQNDKKRQQWGICQILQLLRKNKLSPNAPKSRNTSRSLLLKLNRIFPVLSKFCLAKICQIIIREGTKLMLTFETCDNISSNLQKPLSVHVYEQCCKKVTETLHFSQCILIKDLVYLAEISSKFRPPSKSHTFRDFKSTFTRFYQMHIQA